MMSLKKLAQQVCDFYWAGKANSDIDKERDQFYDAIVHLGNYIVEQDRKVASNQVRTNQNGDVIKICGCYGYGSGGSMFAVSLVNNLSTMSVNGMREEDIIQQFPMVKEQ